MSRRSLAIGLCAVALLWAAAVGAESRADVDAARRNFEAGVGLYEAGDYLGAWRHFDRAYELAPSPALRFSAAQALRLQHSADGDVAHLRRALGYYREYLKNVPRGARRADAAGHIKEIELLLAQRAAEEESLAEAGAVASAKTPQLTVLCSAEAARAVVDGRAPVKLPISLSVTPGQHRVVVSAPGYRSTERVIVVESGQLLPLDVELEALPARVTIVADDAEVFVDGRSLGVAPLGGPVAIAAGRHRVAVGRPGHQAFVRDLELRRGERKQLEVELSSTGQRIASWLLLAGAAGAAVAGGTLAGLAFDAESDARSLPQERAQNNQPMSEADLDAFNHALQRRNDLRLAAVVSLGGAGVLLLSSALAFALDVPDLEVESRRPAPPEHRPEERRAFEVGMAPWAPLGAVLRAQF